MNLIPSTILMSLFQLKVWNPGKIGLFTDTKQSQQSTSWSILLVLANQKIEGKTGDRSEQPWEPQTNNHRLPSLSVSVLPWFSLCVLIEVTGLHLSAFILNPSRHAGSTGGVSRSWFWCSLQMLGWDISAFSWSPSFRVKTLSSLNTGWSNTAHPILKYQRSDKEPSFSLDLNALSGPILT